MPPPLISAGCLHIGNCRLKSNVPWVFVIDPLQDVSVLETPSSKVQYRPKVFGPLGHGRSGHIQGKIRHSNSHTKHHMTASAHRRAPATIITLSSRLSQYRRGP